MYMTESYVYFIFNGSFCKSIWANIKTAKTNQQKVFWR